MGLGELGDRDIIIKQRPAGSVEDGKPEPRPESSDHLPDRPLVLDDQNLFRAHS